MASVNKAIVVGNLGSDPEMTSVNGTVVAKFPIATNARWTDRNGDKQERVEWHNVTAWGRTAEVARDYLKRGSPVYVEGRLQTDSWEADKDGMQHACGRKHYKTHIVVERLQLLGQRETSNDSVLDQAGPEPLEAPPAATEQTEELPF